MSPLGNDRYGQETETDALAVELSERFRERLRFFAARRLRDRDAAEPAPFTQDGRQTGTAVHSDQ